MTAPVGALLAAVVLAAGADPPATPAVPATPAAPAHGAPEADDARLRQTRPVPGTALSIELVSVAAGADGRRLWFGRTEVPWELLDVFVHRLDEAEPSAEADAVTRPSKPYISMDRGFGHHGFPAISVSAKNAQQFCVWLSARTGERYRLPTLSEWRRACAASGLTTANAAESAWCAENAGRKTHPVGSKKPDASGLADLWGNAAEWVVAEDGRCVVVGGSYRDAAAKLDCEAVVEWQRAWNESDPQIPRSEWWLADAGFIGFRIVRDEAPAAAAAPNEATKERP